MTTPKLKCRYCGGKIVRRSVQPQNPFKYCSEDCARLACNERQRDKKRAARAANPKKPEKVHDPAHMPGNNEKTAAQRSRGCVMHEPGSDVLVLLNDGRQHPAVVEKCERCEILGCIRVTVKLDDTGQVFRLEASRVESLKGVSV
jgi:hypothetical protein